MQLFLAGILYAPLIPSPLAWCSI